MDADLTLDPLIGAISAGNAVVLKPSEDAPACSAFLAKTLPVYLDDSAIKVIEGGAGVSEQLLQQKWDKIFFTGITSFPLQVTCPTKAELMMCYNFEPEMLII